MDDKKTGPTQTAIVAGRMDLKKPALEFLLEAASVLKAGIYGDTVMLTIVDEETDPDMEDPIFLTMYLSVDEELAQVAEQVEDSEGRVGVDEVSDIVKH